MNDAVEANSLLHRQERVVFADAGYQGAACKPDAGLGVQLVTLFAFSNLWMARGRLLATQA